MAVRRSLPIYSLSLNQRSPRKPQNPQELKEKKMKKKVKQRNRLLKRRKRSRSRRSWNLNLLSHLFSSVVQSLQLAIL